ncbi:DnaJ-domain-containing protein [Gymnopus androsaceus JB14]|uniref:DnaJ-domain-containing protein n=1 Tax=Gymnopus androsaceus JB14 TaxID=1447944 RepID=A0A6A4IGI2_9AGAR|nr:DnaJ-domain-containing protein [Gymnopus androsaceus JB14]
MSESNRKKIYLLDLGFVLRKFLDHSVRRLLADFSARGRKKAETRLCSHLDKAMAVETELYELLGVSPSASEDEIKKAYRKKARDIHPDKNINDPNAATKFQEMAAAYEILSDPDSRAVYDESGMNGLQGGGPGAAGMDDLFAQFFTAGGGGGGGPSRYAKRNDSILQHEVTLEDLYNGKTVKMNMEKQVLCSSCKGSGAKGSAKPKQCSTCEGNGHTYVKSQMAGGRMAVSRQMCTDCKGSGEKLREKDRCKKCKGSGTVKEKTRQEIFIEKGMADQQRIVLAGAGDEEPGVSAGDVVFVLKAHPHDSFERSKNDLLVKVKITLSEALLGFSRILITHLDGRGIKVTSPPGKILQPDASIVIRGEGMPIYKRPDQKGDLYVLFEIEMPDTEWYRSVDRQALAKLLPPKKPEMQPQPEIVDEANFEEIDVRSQSFPASRDFFDHGFANQRDDIHDDSEGEDWEDDEDEDDIYSGYGAHSHPEPECRQQ